MTMQRPARFYTPQCISSLQKKRFTSCCLLCPVHDNLANSMSVDWKVQHHDIVSHKRIHEVGAAQNMQKIEEADSSTEYVASVLASLELDLEVMKDDMTDALSQQPPTSPTTATSNTIPTQHSQSHTPSASTSVPPVQQTTHLPSTQHHSPSLAPSFLNLKQQQQKKRRRC